MDPPHGPRRFLVRRIDHPGLRRLGKKAHGQCPAAGLVYFVRTEDLKRVFISAFNQLSNFIQGH